jgi:hypothetical protein
MSQRNEFTMSVEHTPRVQILIPTYNAARWFEEALSSVAADGVAEILVIDDGSETPQRDAVEQICRRYADVRFFAEPRRGLIKTLNFGLSIATAPYIGRMDADDISLPGRIKMQMEFLDRHPQVVMLGTQIQHIDEAGVLLRKISYPVSHADIYRELLAGRNLIQHPSVLMRREALIQAGGYDTRIDCAEDYDLWLRLARLGELRNLPEVLLLWRRHTAQISTTGNIKQKYSRDAALLRAHLASTIPASAGLEDGLPAIEAALAPIYTVVSKALSGGTLSWQETRVLGRALSLNLIGEDVTFKRSLIRIIRSSGTGGQRLVALARGAYLAHMDRIGKADDRLASWLMSQQPAGSLMEQRVSDHSFN